MKQKYLILLILAFTCAFSSFAQYANKHHIAPSPWQYWSNANEIIISTLSDSAVTVNIYKSDHTPITTLSVINNNPTSYRFVGSITSQNARRNEIGTTYTDRGLIIEADYPILVNLRNIASDLIGSSSTYTIKGNASLVSFGDEGIGLAFRLGYYRTNFTGLNSNNPIYSAMAIEDQTEIKIDNQILATLNKGESRLFTARTGALLESNKPIVANVGSYGDTPQACNGEGEDGTIDQIAPINSLGTKHLVLRGAGTPGRGATHPEQSTFVAAYDNTIVTVENFTADGNFLSQNQYTLANAGDFESIHHGDAENRFSSSYITSNNPIIIYSGSAVNCETDISTVLPIGGCAGFINIQTTKFRNYHNEDLEYFGYIIVESRNEPVYINGQNIESELTNTPRIPIGSSGFYLLTFTNDQLGNAENLIITSNVRMTTSLIQQGGKYSMSAFFSSFGNSHTPTIINNHKQCSITLSTDEHMGSYQWYYEGDPIPNATEQTLVIDQSGNYSVRGIIDCGETNISSPIFIEVPKCSDLEIKKEVESIVDGKEVIFSIQVTNLSNLHDDTNIIVKEHIPSGYSFINATPTSGIFDSVNNEWHIPLLEKGNTETLLLKTKINPNGEYLNKVTVNGDNFDSNLDNNTDTAEIGSENFYLSKTSIDRDYHNIGDQIEYEIKVKNTGLYTINKITITDDNADIGTLTPNIITQLEPDQEAIIKAKHTITLEEYIAGKVTNQAVATSESFNEIKTIYSDDPRTTKKGDPTITLLNRSADLVTTKTNNQLYYHPGEKTHYTITIKNQGPTAAININVNDKLPEGTFEMNWTNSEGKDGSGDLNTFINLLNVGESIIFNTTVTIPKDKDGDLINKVIVESEIDDPNPTCTNCIDIDYKKPIFPKGISPNNDGKNDFLNLEHFRISKITIYNRYGSEVYTKENYKNEWAGQSKNNELLPNGTYFYHALLITGEIMTGWIQLSY